MGATTWHYYVPFQADINQALQELRNGVFERKEYPSEVTEGEGLEAMKQLAAMSPDPSKALAQMQMMLDLAKRFEAFEIAHGMRRRKPGGEPKTIKALLRRRAESGTSTILDIERVSAQRETGAIYPLDTAQVVNIFGTEHPSREIVEEWRLRNRSVEEPDLYGRWEGFYLIVYANGQPDQLYIEGRSGD